MFAWPDVRGAVSPGEASQAVRPRQLVSFQVSVVQPIRNSSYHGNMREWVMGWVVQPVRNSYHGNMREWDNRLRYSGRLEVDGDAKITGQQVRLFQAGGRLTLNNEISAIIEDRGVADQFR